MILINSILFATEEEIKMKDFKKRLPKRNYSEIRTIEDCFYKTKSKVKSKNGEQVLIKKFENTLNLANRKKRRLLKKGTMKGHKLDYHHNQIKKRRSLKKVG